MQLTEWVQRISILNIFFEQLKCQVLLGFKMTDIISFE